MNASHCFCSKELELEFSAMSELLSGTVSLEAGSPLLDSGGTSPLLEELASVLSMAEDFSSPPVGALGLSLSQAAKMNAASATEAIPQAGLSIFVFIRFSFYQI
jgi:hypothetical protein